MKIKTQMGEMIVYGTEEAGIAGTNSCGN